MKLGVPTLLVSGHPCNYWMSAEEAVAHGMVNRIITGLKAV